MNRFISRLGVASSIAFSCLVTLSSTTAQIVPDNTLPVNSSVAPGCTVCTIEGGTLQGGNLFHSFSEFSVPTGGEAFFNNGLEIENILTRVTGNLPSNVDGLIRANGTANLFLLNPIGIIFGAEATLDIGGSLVASTAKSTVFEDGTVFSATAASDTTPLLTISVPIGLQYGSNPGSVGVQGSSLEVNTGQTLALAGGNVTLEGGQLLAPGGRVELGGVAGEGIVGLSVNGSGLGLSFPDGVPRTDVSLSNDAVVDVAAGGGGSIAINARSLNMTGENTGLVAGIAPNSGSVGSVAGDIEIKAAEEINLNGSVIANLVQAGGVGNAGNVKITTGSLSFTNGAQLIAITAGQGNAGSVNIFASDRVSFDGVSSIGNPSGAGSSVKKTGNGDGGNITITTRELSVTNGAQLIAATLGQGNAGNVNIVARDRVSFDGEGRDGSFPSGAASSVETKDTVGDGGDINITTRELRVTNGAQLTASSLGQGKAGSVNIFDSDRIFFDGVSSNGFSSGAFSGVAETGVGDGGSVNITTRELRVTNGAQLVAITAGQGNAGSVNIFASDRVSFDGVSSDGNPSGAASSVETKDAVGDGGDINITTRELRVTNGAQLVADTRGQGNAGNLNVTANSVLLDNQGILIAETASGEGGNIELQVEDLLLMRNNSLISAEAFNNGNGGNIEMNARLIVAIPSEDSDIVADAFEGRGGNINITTSGIFGLEFREQRTIESDITASSEFGLDGEVTINQPDVDPSQGLTALPTNFVDASGQIDRSCAVAGTQQQSSFVITGTGGLPHRPGDPSVLPFPTVPVRSLPQGEGGGGREGEEDKEVFSPPSSPAPLVEASGWVRGANGEVIIVAQAPTSTAHGSWLKPPTCQSNAR